MRYVLFIKIHLTLRLFDEKTEHKVCAQGGEVLRFRCRLLRGCCGVFGLGRSFYYGIRDNLAVFAQNYINP